MKLRNRFNPAVTLKRSAGFYALAMMAFLTLWAVPAEAWRSELYPSGWQPPLNGTVSFQSDRLIQDFSNAS